MLYQLIVTACFAMLVLRVVGIVPTCTGPFNPCMLPGACDPGKTCTLNAECNVRCVSDTSETTTPSSDTTSDTLGRHCPLGFHCYHGYCDSVDADGTGVRCVCDTGWTGDACATNDSKTECLTICPHGFWCHSNNGSETCQPDNQGEHMTVQPTTAINTNDDPKRNVCGPGYIPRPRSETVCSSGGMACRYGVCVEDEGTKEGICECDYGASGNLCEMKCCLNCGQYGKCNHRSNGELFCNCYYNYTGSKCDEYKSNTTEILPEEVTWHLWVVGACVVVLVTLLFLIVCVPYVMWRHRVILVMKIVHFFQSYEDDDDRSWDAFVSYKSVEKDEKFVVHTLFPKLEQEFGFRLNLHFRDFNPGENISNNIIKAVQSSRRTIMVVTPQYVQSEFTRLEMQVAQQEMLKRRHRIIPVLLEDVKDCSASMDPNLKMILGSVTYIQWPGHDADTKKIDAFWKRLKLALPKKKPVESDTTSSAVLRSSNWQSSTVDPNSVAVKIVNENGVHASERCENVYTTIDDAKAADPEEDYDTLNEADMDGHNESTDHTCNNVTEQEKYLNILNSSPC